MREVAGSSGNCRATGSRPSCGHLPWESSSRTISRGFCSFRRSELVFCDALTENPNSLRDQGLRSPAFYLKRDVSCFTPSVSKGVMAPERSESPNGPGKPAVDASPGDGASRWDGATPTAPPDTASRPTEAHWAFLLWHKRHHQLRPRSLQKQKRLLRL